MLLGYFPSVNRERVLAATGIQSKSSPPFHVWFDIKQVLETDAPRLTRGCLQHEPPEFGMENWGWVIMAPDLISTYHKMIREQLTRHHMFARRALLHPAAGASHPKPMLRGYRPGEETT